MIGLQAVAAVIEIYEAQLVPGLLQTADYARAVLTAVEPELDREQVRRRVELRLARQARLDEDDPPTVIAVLDEAVLHRQIGGPGVLRRQLLSST